MIWLCLLLPACISMKIRYKRNGNKSLSENILMELLRFGNWVLVDNLITMCLVYFVLVKGTITADAFESFGFAIKYIVIASMVSFGLPYILEVCEKYISISLSIGEEDEK